MSTPPELIEQMEASLKTLIEELYADEGITVNQFLYDLKWQRQDSKTIGRFQATDGKTYQFVKDGKGLEVFQEV